MYFNSQICTTKEQAKLLLDLGLKKETADMGLAGDIPIAVENWETQDTTLIDSPAWSLHRLMEMCPLISNPSRFLAVASFKTVYVRMNDEMDVCYAGKGTYNNIINCIEWLIKEGYFNKEYLKKL